MAQKNNLFEVCSSWVMFLNTDNCRLCIVANATLVLHRHTSQTLCKNNCFVVTCHPCSFTVQLCNSLLIPRWFAVALTRSLISTFMKGIGIEFVKHSKNFGTVIDNKCDANCDAVCKKGQQRLYFLRKLNGSCFLVFPLMSPTCSALTRGLFSWSLLMDRYLYLLLK